MLAKIEGIFHYFLEYGSKLTQRETKKVIFKGKMLVRIEGIFHYFLEYGNKLTQRETKKVIFKGSVHHVKGFLSHPLCPVVW